MRDRAVHSHSLRDSRWKVVHGYAARTCLRVMPSHSPLRLAQHAHTAFPAQDGGLRIGEMERDCIIAHGAMAVMKDRLMECSDPFVAPVCCTCGLLCEPSKETVIGTKPASCRNCGPACSGVVMKPQPYAYKLLQHELMAMHIAPRTRLDTGAD